MHLYIIHIRKVTVTLFVTRKKLKKNKYLKKHSVSIQVNALQSQRKTKKFAVMGKGIPIGTDMKSFSSAC